MAYSVIFQRICTACSDQIRIIERPLLALHKIMSGYGEPKSPCQGELGLTPSALPDFGTYYSALSIALPVTLPQLC
jgi:hypothetical protein